MNDKKYSIRDNLVYSLGKLKQLEGFKFFGFVFLFMISTVAVPILVAGLPAFVIQLIQTDCSDTKILFCSLGYIVLILLLRILLRYSDQFQNILFLFRIKLTKEISERCLAMEYEKLENEQDRTYMSKAREAVYRGNRIGIEAFLKHNTLLLVNTVGLVTYSIIAAKINYGFLLLLFLVSGCVIYANWRAGIYVEKNKDEWGKINKKLDYLYTNSIEVANGKDMRLYHMKSWFMNTFHNLQTRADKLRKNEANYQYIACVVNQVMTVIKNLILYGYLIYQVSNGMNVSTFVLYIGIIAGFNTWFEQIFINVQEIGKNSIVVSNYRNYMEYTKPKEQNGDYHPTYKVGKAHEIKFENVSFRYPSSEKFILNNFNLTIRAGERIALVGTNGAGKSTIVKLICGLYKPTTGRILLDGVDISTIPCNEYFKEISAVFQELDLFAFSITDNITCELEEKRDRNKLKDSLLKADLMSKIETLPKKENSILLKELDQEGVVLSGGESQKLMLARALYKNSPIVLLDEPTAALDPIAEHEIYIKYNTLIQGKTSIFVSHRLSSTRFCERILFLENGTIIEEGTHESLMELNGEYAKMYEVQAKYYQENAQKDKVLI